MKRAGFIAITLAGSLMMGACNNSGKSSVNNADSANSAKIDSGTVSVNSSDTKFMVDAANGGMTEVQLGKLAQQKGHSQRVKDFAAMMVRDHSQADDQLSALAKSKNVTLPDSLSEDSQNGAMMLSKKSGRNFDKAYMDMMLDGHQKTVAAFQSEATDGSDAELKQWVSQTLPTIQMHLDSAQAIDSMINSGKMNRLPTAPVN